MSRCRACGREIHFAGTRNRKHQPLNPDGTVHFATCTGKPLRKISKRKPSAHTPKQTPVLIVVEGCPEGCFNGWVAIERAGKSGVVPCPIHRKSA